MKHARHTLHCPCGLCTHLRHTPAPDRSADTVVMALQATAMIAGLVYLAVVEVPGLIMGWIG